MKVVGLTGGIATGKSTLCHRIQEEGIPIVDCDKIAHSVVKNGRWGHKRVVKAFGEGILQADGELDRPALGNLIFTDANARKKLNKATHLPVFVEMFRQLFVHWLKGQKLLFVDMPLLFETGSDKWFGDTVLVTCSQSTQANAPRGLSSEDAYNLQIKRLMSRDGCSQASAEAKVAAQMPLSVKQERSTQVIDNDGSQEEAAAKAVELVGRLKKCTWSALLTSPIACVTAIAGIAIFIQTILN